MSGWNMFSTIKRMALVLALLVPAWLGLSAAVMYLSDDAPAALVVMPSAQLMANIPKDTAILDKSALTITFSSEKRGLTQNLYRAGAYLVLPAGLKGCLTLPVTYFAGA